MLRARSALAWNAPLSHSAVRNAGIAVRGYKFARQARIMQKTPFVDGGPSLEVDVANEGTQGEDFAIAVALFDRKGKLVGVGTGDHTGKLDPGKTVQVKVVFKDLNQEAIYATLPLTPRQRLRSIPKTKLQGSGAQSIKTLQSRNSLQKVQTSPKETVPGGWAAAGPFPLVERPLKRKSL